MDALIGGGTGATRRWLVRQLLDRGWAVRGVVRSVDRLPADLRGRDRLTVIEANLLALGDEALAGRVAGCAAVASCLGHNMTFKGVFGPPRRLVTEATRRRLRRACFADAQRDLQPRSDQPHQPRAFHGWLDVRRSSVAAVAGTDAGDLQPRHTLNFAYRRADG